MHAGLNHWAFYCEYRLVRDEVEVCEKPRHLILSLDIPRELPLLCGLGTI